MLLVSRSAEAIRGENFGRVNEEHFIDERPPHFQSAKSWVILARIRSIHQSPARCDLRCLEAAVVATRQWSSAVG